MFLATRIIHAVFKAQNISQIFDGFKRVDARKGLAIIFFVSHKGLMSHYEKKKSDWYVMHCLGSIFGTCIWKKFMMALGTFYFL